MSDERNRLAEITLDEGSLAPASANAEHERRIALFDLKESNSFAVKGADSGPYVLALAMADGRLSFDVADQSGARVCVHYLPMQSVRKYVKDYLMICDSYHAAIRNAAPSQIEAIDMGRRGLHNEAAEALQDVLADRFTVDLETARRLFTLVCALHARG
jgi:uncharacterized protein (UPF0262 family)